MKQIYIEDNEVVTCENCDREVAEHQRWMHGAGFCSKEPIEIELKVAALKMKILKIQQEAEEMRALPPELQKLWDHACSK